MESLPEKYKTLSALCGGTYKEKGSKFIAYAAPCNTEEEVRDMLLDWKKQHPQARHLCYAYRLGPEMKVYRANDDGEPSNSAGIPILNQIRSFELTNVLIGVVRYFGGIKLGVGGLITAYKEAAREAIINGVVVERNVVKHVQLSFSYEGMAEVMSTIKLNDLEVISTDFSESCLIDLYLPIRKVDQMTEAFKKLRGVEIELKGII